MEQAGIKAKKLKAIGIWIIIFPSAFIWIIGLTLLCRLRRKFIVPIQELNNVIYEYKISSQLYFTLQNCVYSQ